MNSYILLTGPGPLVMLVAPVPATDFNRQLTPDLPDSLRYRSQYPDRYQFTQHAGQVSRYPQDLFADFVCEKWADDGGFPSASRHPLVMADYIPIVLRDRTGAEQYRTKVLLGSGHQANPVRLPLLPGSVDVVVEPLGVWSDSRADAHKRLAQQR